MIGGMVLTVGQPVQWYEEVQINGQPAGLAGGNWDADSGQWTVMIKHSPG